MDCARAHSSATVLDLTTAQGDSGVRAHAPAEGDSHMKAAVLTAVNQELRVPLTVIMGSATTLIQHERRLSRAEQQEFLRTICGATEQLEATLEHLAQLATLEAGPLALRRAPIDLARVVRQSIEAFDEKQCGPQKPWQEVFRLRYADDSSRRTRAQYRVRADAYWLRIAIYYLLERAALQKAGDETIDVLFRPLAANKARPHGAARPARCAMVAGEALFASDRPTRQGILTTIRCVSSSAPPSERIDRTSARSALANAVVGQDVAELGLGYVLCQRIIQLHDGEVCVERGSVHEPNTGARGVFHVLLPTEEGTSGSAARKK